MAIKYVNDAAADNTGNGDTPGTAKKWLYLNIGADDALFNDVANAPAAGDVVYVLENHSENYGNTTISFPHNGTAAAPINIITVDDLTSPTRVGSKANSLFWQGGAGSGANITNPGYLYWQGFELYAYDEFYVGGSSIQRFTDCRLRQGREGWYVLNVLGQSSSTTLINTDIQRASYGSLAISTLASSLVWEGGAMTSFSSSPDIGFSIGKEGGHFAGRGLDLTAMTNGVVTGINSEASGPIVFTRCKLPSASLAPTMNQQTRITYQGCDTGDGYYWFGEYCFEGEIVCDTSNALNATYDGTSGFSALMTTATNVTGSFDNPLRYQLVSIPAVDLTSAQTITVEVSQYDAGGAPTGLTDHEFWIGAEYPDATDLALGQWAYSNGDTGLFETATTLTTSTEVWTQTSNITKQKVTVDLDAVAGADKATITIWAYLSKQNAEVNVCPAVDVSAT